MIYFFHHYELPAILQQVRIQELLANPEAAAQGGEEEEGDDGPNPGQPEEREGDDSDNRDGTPVDPDTEGASSATANEAAGDPALNAGNGSGNQNGSNGGGGAEGVRIRHLRGNQGRDGAAAGRPGLAGLSDLFSVLRRTRFIQQQQGEAGRGMGARGLSLVGGQGGAPVVMDNGRHQYEIERVTVYTESNIYRLFRRLRRRRDGPIGPVTLTSATSPSGAQSSSNALQRESSTLSSTPAAAGNTSENDGIAGEAASLATSAVPTDEAATAVLSPETSHSISLKPEVVDSSESPYLSEKSSGLLDHQTGSERSSANDAVDRSQMNGKNSVEPENPDDMYKESVSKEVELIPGRACSETLSQGLPSGDARSQGANNVNHFYTGLDGQHSHCTKTASDASSIPVDSSFQAGDAKQHQEINSVGSVPSLVSPNGIHEQEKGAEVAPQLTAGEPECSANLSIASVPSCDLHSTHAEVKPTSASNDLSEDLYSPKNHGAENIMRRKSFDFNEGTAV